MNEIDEAIEKNIKTLEELALRIGETLTLKEALKEWLTGWLPSSRKQHRFLERQMVEVNYSILQNCNSILCLAQGQTQVQQPLSCPKSKKDKEDYMYR